MLKNPFDHDDYGDTIISERGCSLVCLENFYTGQRNLEVRPLAVYPLNLFLGAGSTTTQFSSNSGESP